MTRTLQSTRDSSSLQSATAPVREPLGLTGLGRPWAKQVRTWMAFGTRTVRYSFAPKQSTPSTREVAGKLYVGFSPTVSRPPVGQSCPRVQTGAGRAERSSLPEIGGSLVWACVRRHEASLAATVGLGSNHTAPPEIPHESNSNQSLLIRKAQANCARVAAGCGVVSDFRDPDWSKPIEEVA